MNRGLVLVLFYALVVGQRQLKNTARLVSTKIVVTKRKKKTNERDADGFGAVILAATCFVWIATEVEIGI